MRTKVVLSVLLSIAVPIKADVISASVDSFTYSEPYTVKGLLNNLSGSLSRGDVAMTFNEAKISYKKDNWQISILSRLDYLLEFNSDTAALFYQIENKLPEEVGREYDIYLDAHHITSKGIQGGYKWQIDDNTWVQTDVSLLKASKLLSGSLVGSWQETENGKQVTQLDLDYQYSKDLLFKDPVSHGDGNGFAIDVSGGWQYTKEISLDFKVQDLFSKIYWDDVPSTQAKANSISNVVVSNGKVNVQPLLSGKTTKGAFEQDLPARVLVGGNYEIAKHTVRAEVFHVANITFPRLKYKFKYNDNMAINAGYDFKAKSVNAGVFYRGLSLNVVSDKSSTKKAHNLGVRAVFSVEI